MYGVTVGARDVTSSKICASDDAAENHQTLTADLNSVYLPPAESDAELSHISWRHYSVVA